MRGRAGAQDKEGVRRSPQGHDEGGTGHGPDLASGRGGSRCGYVSDHTL